MSDDLVDFRGKFTRDTYQVLSAVSHASGRDMSEIVREVMSTWALNRLHEAQLVMRLTRTEGNHNGGAGA